MASKRSLATAIIKLIVHCPSGHASVRQLAHTTCVVLCHFQLLPSARVPPLARSVISAVINASAKGPPPTRLCMRACYTLAVPCMKAHPVSPFKRSLSLSSLAGYLSPAGRVRTGADSVCAREGTILRGQPLCKHRHTFHPRANRPVWQCVACLATHTRSTSG